MRLQSGCKISDVLGFVNHTPAYRLPGFILCSAKQFSSVMFSTLNKRKVCDFLTLSCTVRDLETMKYAYG